MVKNVENLIDKLYELGFEVETNVNKIFATKTEYVDDYESESYYYKYQTIVNIHPLEKGYLIIIERYTYKLTKLTNREVESYTYPESHIYVPYENAIDIPQIIEIIENR